MAAVKMRAADAFVVIGKYIDVVPGLKVLLYCLI